MKVQELSWQDLNAQMNKLWNARPTAKNKAAYEALRLERVRRHSLIAKPVYACDTCQDTKVAYRSDIDMTVPCKACQA